MNQFVRSLVAELWSWIPTGISFVPPTNLNESTIWTNEGGLHSIIINLARNAIDAMDGKGRLEIDYLIDESSQGVEFEISDTGPGFSEGQMEMLNNGFSIGSSKQNGSGIGLLSVLMLTKELGGSVEFSRNTKGGSRISVCVPSLVPESESMLERDFVQINVDVGEKAIVE
jgi:signal transduction histidine kinase